MSTTTATKPRFSIPHHQGAVTREHRVLRRQRESFGQRLGDQNAIERILVKLRQARQDTDMSRADGERRNARADDILLPPRKRFPDESARPTSLENQFPK